MKYQNSLIELFEELFVKYLTYGVKEMLQIGFSREVITPTRGTPLCGYFNPRPKSGDFQDALNKENCFCLP